MVNNQQSGFGLAFGFTAYFLWGIAPIYFKALDQVSAGEILAHRILWSVPLLMVLLWLTGYKLKDQFTVDREKLSKSMLTGILISINWLVFTWAVTHERILETSLGYFINPLVSVLLAMLVLKETLRALQWVALGFALTGVMVSILHYGQLPWVSLTLAISFGLYGLLKKQSKENPLKSLLTETLLASPFALLFIGYLYSEQQQVFMSSGATGLTALLILGGAVTVIPLWMFSRAAQLLNLATLGFMQYLAPSLTFLLAVYVFNEPLSDIQLLTFVFIWLGLLVYSIDSFVWYRNFKLKRL